MSLASAADRRWVASTSSANAGPLTTAAAMREAASAVEHIVIAFVPPSPRLPDHRRRCVARASRRAPRPDRLDDALAPLGKREPADAGERERRAHPGERR